METSYQQAAALRRLYFVRTAFQLLWACAVFATAGPWPALAAALLVLYPLWDVACTVYDLRTSALDAGTRASQRINAVLGLAAAAGIALTAFSHSAEAIGTFGAWALGAGFLQLAAGILRRKQTGGQWAMILSGLQSTVAGVALGLGGLHGSIHARNLAGYAIFGAFYFLIGGILVTRRLSRFALENALG